MKEFEGKVAVVTGGASGIGRGIAEHCAGKGMKVVLADIEEAALRGTERTLQTAGAEVLAVLTDVSKLDDIETLARKTLDAFGSVHLLFNNAGVQTRKRTWEATSADWEWVINVNLWGVINAIRVFVPIMLRQETECHIINTASFAGVTTGAESRPLQGDETRGREPFRDALSRAEATGLTGRRLCSVPDVRSFPAQRSR